MKRFTMLNSIKGITFLLCLSFFTSKLNAAKFPFTTTDVFATVYGTMADGDTLFLTTPGSTAFYTNFSSAGLTKAITVMADPTLLSRPVLSTNNAGSVFLLSTGNIAKIEFIGFEAYAMNFTDTVTDSRYFLDGRMTAGAVTLLKFKNCYIHGYSRCVVRADGSTPVFTNFEVDSCVFNDNSIGAASYPIFGLKSATISSIKITNSTFYNSPGNILTYSKTGALTFLMDNCTILDCGSFKTRILSSGVYADSNPGRLIDFTAAANTSSTFTLSNTIISGVYTNKENRPLANKVNTGPYSGANIIRFNTTTAANVNFTNSIILGNVFNTPTTPGGTYTPITCNTLSYNFSNLSIITDPNIITGTGDRRWKLNITDATLSDITVDGVSINGFASGTLVYNIELPTGTTVIPVVAATVKHSEATLNITQASSVSGNASIEVTAKDGLTKLTYTINFSLAAASTDAKLSDLKLDGVTVAGFDGNTVTYNVTLPAGTTQIPVVTATTNDIHAIAVITQAPTATGSATVEVTAQDGTTKLTYTVNFNLAASTDASLSGITINSLPLSGFASNTYSYNVELPSGTVTIPLVAATTTENHASAVVTQASSVSGSATIEVTAQDGTTKLTYTINFSVAASTDATLSDLLVNSLPISGFSSSTYTYAIVLPHGTTVIPVVSATATEVHANLVITQATSVSGSATVEVTAQDATTKLTYTINFSVAPSTDATLSDLKVNSTSVSNFASATFTYNVILPNGTTDIPVISATANDAGASVVLTQALSVTGSATAVVTAEDGTTKLTYTVNFSVAPSTDATLSDLKIDGVTVTAFNSNILIYDVALLPGTVIVPTVSATTNEANASISITQSPSVNGTATIEVTAQDGTTKKTYKVNFSILTSVAEKQAGKITISYNQEQVLISSSNSIVKIQIVDLSGKVLYKMNVNSNTHFINKNEIGTGIFILSVKTNSAEFVNKILIKN